MSVVIRMKRAGAKKRPFYRVVVADSRFARDGRYIEQLGYYDPLTDPAKFHIDADKFADWIRKGAKPSESVGVMMAKHAPAALRPVPLLPIEPGAVVVEPEDLAPIPVKPTKAKAKAKAKAAAPKTARKARTATKASEKKAKTRAKAKAKKASGIAKPRKAKKAKKSKK